MLANNPYQQYKKNSVQSATPGDLTLSLYNGAVKFIKLGIIAIDEGNIQGANNAIVRAQEIIIYLMETLNHEYEISKNLSSLYDYINSRLLEANIKKDKQILEESLEMVKELRDTWGQAVKLTAGKK